MKFRSLQLMTNRKSIVINLTTILILTLCVIQSQSNPNQFKQTQNSNIEGVLLLNQQNFQQALQQFSHLTVLFSQKNCSFCQEMQTSYLLASEKYWYQNSNRHKNETIQFSKIYYTTKSKDLFSQYHIVDVPQLYFFEKGKILPYEFSDVGYDDQAVLKIIDWIQRLTKNIPLWNEGFIHQKSIIINCNSKLYPKFNDYRKKDLTIKFFCSDDDFVELNQAVIHQKGQNIEILRFEELQNLTQDPIDKHSADVFEKKMQAYKWRNVLPWDHSVGRDIFVKNQNAFILIYNNDNHSLEIQQCYHQVIRKWSSEYRLDPILSSQISIQQNTQQALKVKRYLMGSNPVLPKQYPYPVLGFLHMQNIPTKYLFYESQKQCQDIQSFMKNVYKKVLKNQTIDTELYPWVNQQSHSKGQESRHIYNHTPSVVWLRTMQQCYKILSVDFKRPFILLFMWRYDLQNQLTLQRLKGWWQNEQKSKDKDIKKLLKQKVNIYIHGLPALDIPIHPDLNVKQFPSIYYFSNGKMQAKLQGVTNLQKIKKFIIKKANIQMEMNSIESSSQLVSKREKSSDK